MTVEIAIMNRESVALASDSAVTIGIGDKIYNSANKLFALSKHYPVGIMVFGNANLMGIPWETIIKKFRKKLNKTNYGSLVEYAHDFLNYLASEESGIDLQYQMNYIRTIVPPFFLEIRQKSLNMIESKLKEKGSITRSEVENIISELINEDNKKYEEGAQNLEKLKPDYKNNLKKTFEPELDNILRMIFENLPLNKENEIKLKDCMYNILSKEWFFDSSTSGIVIAGFGENELYPSLISYKVESTILNQVKYKLKENIQVDSSGTSWIAPYAQTEMVDIFIKGIDNDYRYAIELFVEKNFENLSNLLIENLDEIKNESPANKQKTSEKLNKINKELLDNFKKEIETYSRKNYTDSIMSSVAILPKDELANMAEALVNLTSFKRRVASNQKETVGGPIDVAVISKGDGFIWIKRKHYFKPEFNHHFFKNYFE